MSEIEIRNFRVEDAAAFREVNEAWIEKYFVLEAADRVALGDPCGHILKPGGHIFVAEAGGRVIATCALIAGHEAGEFEVAKMGVADGFQGRGIGRKLLSHTVEQARGLGARVLRLETNSILGPAIHLYESMGFRHLEARESPYARADVFMEMSLGD